MKKFVLAAIALIMCLNLCSCERLLRKAKAYVTGIEDEAPPADFLESRENDVFSYDVYKDHIELTGYLGESTELIIPSEIDGKPVTVIGSLFLFEKAKVTSVEIPSSVTALAESAFYYADALTSVVIPDTVRSIGVRAFSWCNALESVSIGSGIDEIPDYCFNHCVSLTEFKIPENVGKVGVRTFSYCSKLVDVIVTAGVGSVGERAFANCAALEYVEFRNAEVQLAENVFEGSDGVTLISPFVSSAKDYCAEHGMRWSQSRFIEAIIPGSLAESSANEESEQ